MSLSAAGTTFRLRTPAHIKSCHMTGSWDNYGKRYAMKPDSAAGAGWWTLTLKFGSSMATGRYWYYYILDGYFESHDPNKPTCKEPTRNITLNILDYYDEASRPSSAATSISSGSSRYSSSPTSSIDSPVSSKRSGGVYSPSQVSSHSRSSSGSSHRHSEYYPDANSRRTPSPRRRNMEMAHLLHPKPRNPMGHHKLTLDTAVGGTRNYRDSTITNAATVYGSNPSSAGSTGSSCSACSGSTFSDGSSPTTPLCTCEFHDGSRECAYESDGLEYSDDSCFEDEEEDIRAYKYRAQQRRKTYHAKVDADELSYRLERGLRI